MNKTNGTNFIKPQSVTNGTDWLNDALAAAQNQAAVTGQPVTINITLNDNSVHTYDNRSVVVHQAPWRQRQTSLCSPSRFNITGGYVYDPSVPLDPQRLADEAAAGYW